MHSFRYIQVRIRDVISVFSRGGKILTDFLGGAKYEKNKTLCAKTQKITIFENQGGAPQMTSLSRIKTMGILILKYLSVKRQDYGTECTMEGGKHRLLHSYRESDTSPISYLPASFTLKHVYLHSPFHLYLY